MTKGRKRAGRLIALGLGLMMLMSAGVVAQATTYGNGFYFKLEPGGEKKQTGPIQKTDNNLYASIHFTICENPSSYPVWYRVRTASGDEKATNAYQLHGTGFVYPPYFDGYGEKLKFYRLRAQTDSESTDGATVAGSWKP